MSGLELEFDGLGALFNYDLEGNLPPAKRAEDVPARYLEDASASDLDKMLESMPEELSIQTPPGFAEFELMRDVVDVQDEYLPTVDDLSKPIEQPVGLTVVVLEDEEVLRNLYMGVFKEELTSETFEEMGLPGLPKVNVIGFDSVAVAVQHFKDNSEKYQNQIVAASIDLNLRGASEQSKNDYAQKMAMQEVESIPALQRGLSLRGMKKGSLAGILAGVKDQKDIIAGHGPGYDAWFAKEVEARAPKYLRMATAYGNKVVGELLSIGVKLAIADINSAEESSSIAGAIQPLINRASQGYFPIATANQKTAADPRGDAERLAAHIKLTASELLKAYNHPNVAEFVGSNSGSDEEFDIHEMAQGVAEVYHGLLKDHAKAQFTLSNMGSEYAPLKIEDIDF